MPPVSCARSWRAPAARAAAACALLAFTGRAHAARYLDVSLDGMYQRNDGPYKLTTYQTLGVDLGIPLTEFMDLSLGHMISVKTELYNETYKLAMRERGLSVPDVSLVSKEDTADTYVNAAFGVVLGYVRPTLFGGVLWRKMCNEDTFEDLGCEKPKLTWNAGAGASAYITMGTRLKISFRVSPPVTEKKKFKELDQKLTVGLAWSL